MKNQYLVILFIFLFCQCKKDEWGNDVQQCTFSETINPSYSKAPELQAMMDKYVKVGIPGISVAVLSDEGLWTGTSGYARIENRVSMQPCHLQYSQSIAKTYMSVAILRLYEMKKLELDNSIVNYLPENISSMIADANKISVRMLLNHTSGIAEYNSEPKYVTYLLQHPLHKFSSVEYLEYIKNRPLRFEPGTDYAYTNTNYLLLALIGDYITGNHAQFIRDDVFLKSGAFHSFYHESPNYLDKDEIVNSYWDRYSNGAIENCTKMQKINVGSLVGDDGIVATSYDYVYFMKALFSKQLIADSTMFQMLTFVPNPKDDNVWYGLGIHKEFYNGMINYGHSGGGIGGGCYLVYFPDKNIYFFLAINLGTSVYSSIFDNAENIVEDFYNVLLK